MKYGLFVYAWLLASASLAQGKKDEDVLAAEKAFAAYSVAHGTKEAFLKFLDSNSVVFENGNAVNGIATWKKKEQNAGILNWHPVYVAVAASGDLAFTTGPWAFQPKTTADSVVARGRFSTVWKKNGAGEWKALIDLGNSAAPSLNVWVYGSEIEKKFIPGTWNNLLNREQKFIAQTATQTTRYDAYFQALSRGNHFLNRNGQLSATGFTNLDTTIKAMPQTIGYTIGGSGISTGGDLGYVYGTTTIDNKTENYLRIWRREGKEWKLALEVLRY